MTTAIILDGVLCKLAKMRLRVAEACAQLPWINIGKTQSQLSKNPSPLLTRIFLQKNKKTTSKKATLKAIGLHMIRTILTRLRHTRLLQTQTPTIS